MSLLFVSHCDKGFPLPSLHIRIESGNMKGSVVYSGCQTGPAMDTLQFGCVSKHIETDSPRGDQMLKMIANLLKILNSEADPFQISVALGLSMVTGFLPLFTPLNLLILLLVLVLRVNISSYILGSAFFAGVAWFLDPLFHRIGFFVLTAGPLEGLWTAFYNTAIGRLQRFNNSVVMGSFVFSLVFFVPLVLIMNAAIRRYREHLLIWVKKTRIMQMIMASKLYSLYEKLS
jgi:uncharacterized protein (TIGR03546 family)